MRFAALLFAVGLLLRLLFVVATPDRDLAYAHALKGDAPLWQQLANEAAHPPTDRPLDPQLRLPLRPPAMHWLVSSLWDGNPGTAWRLRGLFAVLGALLAPLLYLGLRREFPARTAALAGGLAAVSTQLMLLSSGLHVETPYLVLVLLAFLDWPELRAGARPRTALRFGLLHGLAALLRAEHPLGFALLLLLAFCQHPEHRLRPLLLAALAFALTLLPWQLTAMQQVQAFNHGTPPALPTAGNLPWDADALAAVQALPSFQQLPVFGFVTDTARTRGERRVGRADLRVIEEAYGYWPEPLHVPTLSLYGPLNFFLANAPESDGGFSNAALRRPPPLAGGPQRYPPGLLQVLPLDGRMTPDFPPHLQALNHGYALGLDWLMSHPGDAARLLWRKLQFFWQGAATGLGGFNLPMGLSGTRRQVDMVTADGPLAAAWRLLLLAMALGGVWQLRRQPALLGWLVPLTTALLASALFFGYARLGALALPSVLLLLAACLQRATSALPAALPRRIGWLSLLLLVAVEGLRALTASPPAIDDRTTATGDPFPPLHYAVRKVRY